MNVPAVPIFQPPSHKLTNFIIIYLNWYALRHFAIYLQLYQLFWSIWDYSCEEAWWCLHWDRKCSPVNSSWGYHNLSVSSQRWSHVTLSLSTIYEHFFPISHTCPKGTARCPVPPYCWYLYTYMQHHIWDQNLPGCSKWIALSHL